MTTADVPADGEVRIGAIRLTAGRRIRSNGGRGEPVAWATAEPVPDAGRAWPALSEAHAQSGLVPVLLDGIAGDPERPWDTQEFRDPDDMTELDDLNVAELMREDWLNKKIENWEDGGENEDEDDVKSFRAVARPPRLSDISVIYAFLAELWRRAALPAVFDHERAAGIPVRESILYASLPEEDARRSARSCRMSGMSSPCVGHLDQPM